MKILFIVIMFLFVFFVIIKFSNFYPKKNIIIAGENVEIELAVSAEEKAKGLSNRDSIPERAGMLFVYENDIIPTFWMKEMLFPIDIIWIKDDMVVGYESNIKPQPNEQSSLVLYKPKTFINYVLEVNSGFVEKHQIKIGDRVEMAL